MQKEQLMKQMKIMKEYSIAKNAKKFLKNCENNKIRVLKLAIAIAGLEGVKEQESVLIIYLLEELCKSKFKGWKLWFRKIYSIYTFSY